MSKSESIKNSRGLSGKNSRGTLRTLFIFIKKAKSIGNTLFYVRGAYSFFAAQPFHSLYRSATDFKADRRRRSCIKRTCKLGVILVAAYLGRAVCRFISLSQSHVAAWNFVGELTLECYDKLQSLSMRYYSDKQTGQLMSTMLTTAVNELLIAHSCQTSAQMLL